MNDELLSTCNAAIYLGLKPQTLRQWRVDKQGPSYIRFGDSPRAKCCYRLTELDQWLQEHTVDSCTTIVPVPFTSPVTRTAI